ncbi:MAG: cupin domain-containing protein [Proteobacteria bacterium]|nr:MAG: cupin domain-containing protein [Pseudomonadota bacterium]
MQSSLPAPVYKPLRLAAPDQGMRYFARLYEGLDVAPMLAEIEANPELWDAHPERRIAPGSPHRDMVDIHLRARDRADLADPDAFRLPHCPIFYPAWRALPSLHEVVYQLMAASKAVELGNVLLTRIRPGHSIHPHVDPGWAVNWFETKFYVVLQTNAAVLNFAGEGADEERVHMAAGSIWRFENRVRHGLDNRGDTDRMSLIVSVRCSDAVPLHLQQPIERED